MIMNIRPKKSFTCTIDCFLPTRSYSQKRMDTMYPAASFASRRIPASISSTSRLPSSSSQELHTQWCLGRWAIAAVFGGTWGGLLAISSSSPRSKWLFRSNWSLLLSPLLGTSLFYPTAQLTRCWYLYGLGDTSFDYGAWPTMAFECYGNGKAMMKRPRCKKGYKLG